MNQELKDKLAEIQIHMTDCQNMLSDLENTKDALTFDSDSVNDDIVCTVEEAVRDVLRGNEYQIDGMKDFEKSFGEMEKKVNYLVELVDTFVLLTKDEGVPNDAEIRELKAKLIAAENKGLSLTIEKERLTHIINMFLRGRVDSDNAYAEAASYIAILNAKENGNA